VPLPSYDGYLDRWSALHGGYDARSSRLVGGWLRLAYSAARPFAAAGLSPNAVTVLALVVSAAVVPVAAAGGRWPLLAAAAAVAAGLLDNVDGTVAVLTERVTRVGYVLDSACDRLADAAYLLALWRLGAPAGLSVAAGAALGLLEYVRARAGNAGLGEIGVVTVGERPTRIVVAAVALLCAGLYPAAAVLAAGLGAAATFGVSGVGLVQLALVVRRLLR
jgi:CDP-diacylglycerol--glycerol-3-phosphate 3-phosphatidyltransferase